MTTGRRVGVIAAAGGIGGAIDAALCLAQWPARVQDSSAVFRWHLVPAGLAHGALLALVGAAAAAIGFPRSVWKRALAIVGVGWIGGYLSYVPLDLSAFSGSVEKAVLWPINDWSAVYWHPYFAFGIVPAALYVWLGIRRPSTSTLNDIAVAIGAAVAGSLWWWIAWGPWYFSPLHGAIWGFLVGSAIQRANHRQG